MRTRTEALVVSAPVVAALVGLSLGACLPGSGPPPDPYVDDAGPPPNFILTDSGTAPLDVDLGDPFAVIGLLPSHGPWSGGTRTTIAGRGFASNVEVTIGATVLDPSQVFASSSTRITVVTPPGTPGPADVTVRDLTTAQQRTLSAGFAYDAFVLSPDSGSTTGGTRVALQGSGTQWAASSTVTVGGQPCTAVVVTDSTHLACVTPAGSPGTTDVAVANADGTVDQARDAYTYSDSPDGYRGGLYGGALSGTLNVLAFDALTGTPLSGGVVIAGSTLATALTGVIGTSGAVTLQGSSLSGAVTVTIAGHCHQPLTYVDVPVDTVTAYLLPELDPSCGQGDPPSTGNFYPVQPGVIEGQLVWTGGIEFERSTWSNVPMPVGDNERQAAYVFTATGSPLGTFYLPGPDSATTPASSGQLGYAYSTTALPGNQTIYALAGIEDRSVSPPRFEPYAMGVASGVLVQPGGTTDGVDIPMTSAFDHSLTTVPQPPQLTPRGPDRLVSNLAINLGAGLYAILPQGSQTNLLPIGGSVPFVGIPGLDGTLSSATYDLTGLAVTGANGDLPVSVVAGIDTNDSTAPLTMGGFFAVPSLVEPAASAWSGTHVTLQASGPIDLAMVSVSSGGGLVGWQIVTPGTDLSFDLPDLTQVPGVTSLVRGPLITTFTIARIPSFDYGRLRSGQLGGGAWSAYAQDQSAGAY